MLIIIERGMALCQCRYIFMKSNEFSKAIGIPVSTVRYYDRQGITKSQREGDNNYRDFDAMDALDIYNALMLRSFDIGVAELLDFQKQQGLSAIRSWLGNHIPDLAEQIRLEEMKLKRLKEMQAYLDLIISQQDIVLPVHIEDSYAIYNLEYINNITKVCDSSTQTSISQFAEVFPYSYVVMKVDECDMLNEALDTLPVKLGLGMLRSNLEKCGLTPPPDAVIIPSRPKFSMYFVLDDPFRIDRSILAPIFKKIAEEGARPCGDIIGRMYISYNQDGKKVYGASLGISYIK